MYDNKNIEFFSKNLADVSLEVCHYVYQSKEITWYLK